MSNMYASTFFWPGCVNNSFSPSCSPFPSSPFLLPPPPLSLSPSLPPSLALSFSRPRSSGTAMKLGSRGKKNVDSFVDQLVAEGESKFLSVNVTTCSIDDLYHTEVTSASAPRQPAAVATKTPAQVNMERSVFSLVGFIKYS